MGVIAKGECGGCVIFVKWWLQNMKKIKKKGFNPSLLTQRYTII